jgi:hypothetical protein
LSTLRKYTDPANPNTIGFDGLINYGNGNYISANLCGFPYPPIPDNKTKLGELVFEESIITSITKSVTTSSNSTKTVESSASTHSLTTSQSSISQNTNGLNVSLMTLAELLLGGTAVGAAALAYKYLRNRDTERTRKST